MRKRSDVPISDERVYSSPTGRIHYFATLKDSFTAHTANHHVPLGLWGDGFNKRVNGHYRALLDSTGYAGV